jgi:hypothetical protein
VDDPSDPAVFELVDKAISAYEYAPGRQLSLTSSSEVLHAIREISFGNTSYLNGVANRVLRHIRKYAMTFLKKVFNAVLQV